MGDVERGVDVGWAQAAVTCNSPPPPLLHHIIFEFQPVMRAQSLCVLQSALSLLLSVPLPFLFSPCLLSSPSHTCSNIDS